MRTGLHRLTLPAAGSLFLLLFSLLFPLLYSSSAAAQNICDKYQAQLKTLIKGAAGTEFRGGNQQTADLFGCNATDQGAGRVATLSVKRDDRPAQVAAGHEKSFPSPAFRITRQAGLGAGGFRAVGSVVQAKDDEYLAYFGHNDRFLVAVTLAKAKPADRALSADEDQAVKTLVSNLLREWR